MNHSSEKIKAIIGKIGKIEGVREIWEIGSRDGQDARIMSEVFPLAKVKAFEPNPDTFRLVEQTSLASNGHIKALNIALSNCDGDITFHKIDTTSTITSWLDGNPGASSLFIASEDYDIEKYIQIPIKVMSKKAMTLIEDERFAIPNLIWMDVQGAEKLVLEGFDKYLSDVDFIYVELSLRRLYQEQPLAGKVVKLLSKNFLWHSNLSMSTWQFDGLFVNKTYQTPNLRSRNFLLNVSLKSGLNIGIKCSFISFLKAPIKKYGRGIYHQLLSFLRRSDNKNLGHTLLKVLLGVSRKLRIKQIHWRIRQVISLSQPLDPLNDKLLPTIDIAIPCHSKDSGNLQLVIQGAQHNVKNPIGKIYLVTPEDCAIQFKVDFPECIVLTDQDILGIEITAAINELVPKERRGWVFQQAIKFRVAMNSEAIATLIIDADTILLSPKVWLDAVGTQILCLGYEYHLPYKQHQRIVFGGASYPLSFVTHHQLMKKDTLIEIFGQNNQGLISWLTSGDYSKESAISEYDTYGEYMVNNKPSEVLFSKWNNLASKIQIAHDGEELNYSKVARIYSSYCSVSNHSYL